MYANNKVKIKLSFIPWFKRLLLTNPAGFLTRHAKKFTHYRELILMTISLYIWTQLLV